MLKPVAFSILLFLLGQDSHAQVLRPPDTVTILSDSLSLKGLLWRPEGKGVFPAIIFCHGSYETSGLRYDAVKQTSVLGPLFAKNNYVFLALFRRGTALSKDQGENSADLMNKALKERGQEGRNRVQMQQLLTNDQHDIFAGLEFLRERNDVDIHRLAVIGHSFGGSLALLVTEHHPGIRAVVVFGAGGYSWNSSPQLRTALIESVKKIDVPVMLVYAQNDYSLNPAYSLDSTMNLTGKQHVLKIYPSYGGSSAEGHNIIFLDPDLWQEEVFKFLHQYLQR